VLNCTAFLSKGNIQTYLFQLYQYETTIPGLSHVTVNRFFFLHMNYFRSEFAILGEYEYVLLVMLIDVTGRAVA